MNEFQLEGGVAVITGAASGLGRAIADACAARRMQLMLVDIDRGNLDRAVAELTPRTRCLARAMDVRDRAAFEELSDSTFAAFGAVDVLFNNAGSVIARPLVETRVADWRWMLEVNLWSVIHGIAAFVPRMLTQGREGRIVNTASAAGFLSEPDLGAYAVSKHAVVAERARTAVPVSTPDGGAAGSCYRFGAAPSSRSI
jgi:NADP-dependent 3-hydroxy acid dehydrogenase YdfG